MTYDEAVASAKAGNPVIRQHWCWVQLCYSAHNDSLFLDNEDGERKGWRPTKEDQSADDWMPSPLSQ